MAGPEAPSGRLFPYRSGDSSPHGGETPEPREGLTEDIIEAWDLRSRPGLQAILEGLQHDRTTPEWTLEDLRTWLLDNQEKAPTTVEDRLRHLRFMESYSPQPVKLLGTRYQFVLSGRLYYHVRKQTGSGPGALQKDLKCLRTLGRFLGVPKEV